MRLTFRRRVAVTATGAAVAASALTAGTAGAWVSVPAHSASGQTVAGTVRAEHGEVTARVLLQLQVHAGPAAAAEEAGCPQVGSAGEGQSRLGGPPTVRVSNPHKGFPGKHARRVLVVQGALGPVLLGAQRMPQLRPNGHHRDPAPADRRLRFGPDPPDCDPQVRIVSFRS